MDLDKSLEGPVYCFSCGSNVAQPHICPTLYGGDTAKTHSFTSCIEHTWHGKNAYYRCEKCRWHVRIDSLKDIRRCAGSPSPVAASTYTGLESNAEILEKDVEFRAILREDFALPPKREKKGK